MKKSYRSIVALLLSLLLVVLCGTPARATQTQEQFETFTSVSTVIVSEPLQVGGPMPGDTQDYITTTEEAVQILRQGMQNREKEIIIPLVTEDDDTQLMSNIWKAALEHTGEPTQGDYLHRHLGKIDMLLDGYRAGTQRYLTLTYTIEYYTTAAQEAEMDQAVKTLLDQLDVYDASAYEKVCAIYDYMCHNITYDYAGLEAGNSKLIYTAYAALINKTAVCQGYASLFYRLALELGVDARLIPGKGNGAGKWENHGWNIVRLRGKYYNLDATWDATRAQGGWEYAYFLRSTENFPNHIRNEEFDTDAFHSAYPMDTENYVPASAPLPGDMDGNEEVNSDDVIRLLLYLSAPSMFPVNAQADFTHDGTVNSNDVIRLLLHVSMPSAFPL